VNWLESHLDIVARHTEAGFEHVPDEHVQWHYALFLRFLAEKGYVFLLSAAERSAQ
jgi:hypothetical protein